MHHPTSHTLLPVKLQRALWLTALLSLAMRLWIGWTFPITGDEAFFYWWGVYPDWGYYDHPPMVGWVIALMRAVYDTTLGIRLPIIALPLALGGLMYWAWSPLNKERAAWAVLLFWLAPINWLNALITTDTPLIFWSMVSVACLVRAEQKQSAWGLYALSGLALGCAFLSKYFSVVLGLCYLVYFLAYRRERWMALALMVLCALPGPLINFSWNMSHGWPNIMFNVYNRNADAGFAWNKPFLYLGMMAYLMSPVVLWLWWRERAALKDAARQQRILACLVLVPLAFFSLLSLKKVVGLHWVLSFYPFGFALLAWGLPKHRLATAAIGLAVFTGLHALAVVGISLTTPEQWVGTKLHTNIIRSYKTEELLDKVQNLPPPSGEAQDVVLMSDAYTPASIYGYTRHAYMPVFGPGKFHARQDDMLVDYSVYQGKTVRVILSDTPKLDDFAPYFQSVRALQVEQSGVTFHVVEGTAFDFEAYRRGVLGEIFKRYYNIPTWLPMTGCPFCVRYCGQVRCP